MATPVNETPEQARARTAATAQANIEARKANAQQNANTTPSTQMGTVQPVAPTTQQNTPQPVQVATTNIPVQTVQPATAPTMVQPSYTSKEGITTVSPVTETPEQARARTAATAQANITAREQVQLKPTVAQQVPEVTKEITTTAPKVLPKKEVPVVDYNSSVGRESEIQKNLQEGLATNPSLFKDKNAFFKAYGYDKADAGKRTLLEKFYEENAQKVGTPEWIFGLLALGQKNFDQATKNTPAFTNAQARFDYVAPYKNATTTSIYDAMVSGKLSPESTSYQDLITINGGVETPAMQEAKKKYETKKNIDNINRSAEINYAASTGKKATTPTSITQNISDDIINTKGMDYAEEFKKAVSQNPELVKLSTELSAVSERILAIEDEKAAILKGIEKQYPGITTGAAALLASQQSEALDKEYKGLQNKQAVMSANLTYQTNLADKAFEYKIKQAETERQAAEEKAASDLAFERQKQLAQYQSQLALTTDQKKFEQNLAQQAQLAKDPTTATNALLKQYAELGILPQRSSQEIIADIQAQVASGKPLGQALSELNQAFQSKTEYKNAIAKKFAPEDTGWKLSNITTTDADGNQVTRTVEYNDKTGQIREIGATGGGVGTSTTGQGSGVIPSGTFVDFTSSLKRTGNNVGQDTNNPGNIMAESEAGQNYAKSLGAVGFYKSPNGRTYAVFPDMDTGKAAALSDLSTKLSGGSSWASGDTTLGKFASGWTSGPNAAYNKNAAANYARLTGFSENTRIKDIPRETLLNAIIANEGVNPNKSADVGAAYVSTTPAVAQEFLGALQRGEFTTDGQGATSVARQYTATETALLNKYLKDPSDKAVKAEMKKQGLTQQDANSYAENKPKTTELSDDQRTIFNSQLSSFRGNKVVKDFEDQIGQVSSIASSLGANSGPGDIAAVFQFMKTLDPSSVVREGEFALAAKSAGIVGSVQNMFTKLENGQMLTDEQKKQFASLTNAYLQKKASQYDRLYDDMARVTKLSGIPEDYLPRRASLDIPPPTSTKTITQDGYDMLVIARGKEWADNYIKSKGLTVK